MEKRKPHYDLDAIIVVVRVRGVDSFTKAAKDGAVPMGLSHEAALEVVLHIQRGHLFKSMTTHADPSVWQDVYRVPCLNGKMAYIKLTLRAGVVVIQFKEL
jgi:motility quorum-sensing regulator/GCU-specific mRNA interferase toxin